MSAMTLSTASTLRPASPDGWTVDDLDALPGDSGRHELLDGTLLVSPPEAPPNLLSAHRLCTLLETALGKDFLALPGGAGVVIEPGTYFTPDVVVFPRTAYGEEDLAASDVLLVYEAMSPSSRTMDRVVKPARLAEAGVPHYWRLERRTTLVLVTHVLDGAAYVETGRFTDEVHVDVPVPMAFRVGDLLV